MVTSRPLKAKNPPTAAEPVVIVGWNGTVGSQQMPEIGELWAQITIQANASRMAFNGSADRTS